MSGLPVIAIVGRPNVGKSTLFNFLTRTRDALVADEPGMTRDRQYGRGVVGPRPYLVVDTGGLTDLIDGIDPLVTRQAGQALEEADTVLFLVDGRAGMNAADQAIAEQLRRQPRPVYLVINKTEGMDRHLVATDFHALGLGQPWTISSAHGQGVRSLMDEVDVTLPETPEATSRDRAPGQRIAVVGRPNVGKSTLINRMVGEDRVLAFDQPGTTRDSIDVPFERRGQHYILVDTAGVRRRGRVSEKIEKFSIIKTLQAIEKANVVVLLIDARDSVTDQDTHLLGHVLNAGRALVVAANKWDGLDPDHRDQVRRDLERRLAFVDFADLHFISARHGTGVGDLFASIDRAWASASRNMGTPELTRILEAAVAEHGPPLIHGRRIKLRYAHQGGQNPPVIVIHGNQTERVPESYRRFLTGRFRKALDLHGTPVRLEFKTGDNPYKDRKNKLTPRQVEQRKRLMRHVKR